MASPFVKFNVSGQTFSIFKSSLELGPYSKLKHLALTQLKHSPHGTVEVDRPANMFAAILSLYQTGTLHIPANSCPLAFLAELRYWEIRTEFLSECCYIKLQCFLEEQQAITKFRVHERKCHDVTQSRFSTLVCSRMMNARIAIWKIFDSRSRTMLARVYFFVCLLMVTTSLLTIACGTVHRFQRNMTNCERLGVMRFSGMENVEFVKDDFEAYCDDHVFPNTLLLIPQPSDENGDADIATLRVDTSSKKTGSVNSANNTCPDKQSSNETDPVNKSSNKTCLTPLTANDSMTVKVPNMPVRHYSLDILDTISTVFFTLDLLLRVLCCPCIRRYFSSPINLADTVALAATYIHIIALGNHRQVRFRKEWYGIIEYLQMFRSLRFFRIVTFLPAGRVLMYTMVANTKDILVFIIFILSGMCVFASVLYVIEGSENLDSIPLGWYWAVITMTTVGYGDIKPVTAGGRLLACVCGVSGLLLFAMTVPIFANHFMSLYTYINSENIVEKVMKDECTLPKVRGSINIGDASTMKTPTKEKLALDALDMVTAVN